MEKTYIEGYEGEYEVHSDGRIYSYKSNKFLKPGANPAGYLSVSLCLRGDIKQFMIHRIVALAFIENPENKPEVNHKNGIVSDNRVENLEWCTRQENMQHSIRVLNNPKPPLNFLNKFGYDHNRSKEVKVIIDGKLLSFGSGLEFKRETGLDNTAISYAKTRMFNNGETEYLFTRGKMKGIVLLK